MNKNIIRYMNTNIVKCVKIYSNDENTIEFDFIFFSY